MKTILQGILAVLGGLVAGGVVNMGLIFLGPKVIPPPAGVDVTKAESIAANIHRYEPKHFAVPFLAHALGTLTGATVAGVIAARRRRAYAYGIGAVNLAGGIAAATMIPAPVWFIVLDLGAAYLPMAWLGAGLAFRLRRGADPASAT